jgi:predicted MPP superfamily phosphohydrolase
VGRSQILGRLMLFLLIFISLYGSLHLYGFLKVRAALSFGVGSNISLGVFMAIMVFAPIIVRVTEKLGFELLARILAYIGYIWMGLLFLFFSASLILDFYRLLVYLGGLILQKDFSQISLSSRSSFFIPLLLSIMATAYGYFEAIEIRPERVFIRTPKIPAEVGKLRIVQISDVHLGLIVREGRLRRILKEVKSEKPDILVSTGDLVDGQIDDISGFANMFREINTTYGKFAVTGNHEFYAGISRTLDFTEKAGFSMLRGEGLNLSGVINIAGIDDPAGMPDTLAGEVSEKTLLSRLSREKFTLLLKHRPLVDKNTMGLFDLQLSGHTHKGQIFPFSLITKLFYPADAGRLSLQDNVYLYVSRGSGTWGPPIRFLAPPEVTVIELIHDQKST